MGSSVRSRVVEARGRDARALDPGRRPETTAAIELADPPAGLTRELVLRLQRAAGNRAVANAVASGPRPRAQRRSLQRLTVLSDSWAGLPVVRFDPADQLPGPDGLIAGAGNWFYVPMRESRLYARRPRQVALTTAAIPRGAAQPPWVKKYIEYLLQRFGPGAGDDALRRYVRMIADPHAAPWVATQLLQSRALATLGLEAVLPAANQEHQANWGILQALLDRGWDPQLRERKWAGVKDIFYPNPQNRSKNWWIQYVYQEAQQVDPDRAAVLIDRIMSDVNVVRPQVLHDDTSLRRYLRDLIDIGFMTLTEADFVPTSLAVEEDPARRVSKITRPGPTEVAIPRPSMQLRGIGFRSEDRPKDELSREGLVPKLETPKASLRAAWNFDTAWFPFDRGKIYFRLGKGDNDLDTLTSVALNIADVSKFPLLEEPNTVTQYVPAVGPGDPAHPARGDRWTSRATVSIVRVRKLLDTQAMQAVTEQSAFGHGEKATLVIPPSDILAFLEIERSWDATLPRESNSNPHKFTLVGNPDWRGRSDTELEETLADQDLLRSDRPAALAAGRAALVELRTYLAELQNGVVVYDTPTAGSTAESLALPPGSTAIAAKARQGKRAQLEHLHSRTNARFRVHYNTIFGQELYVVGDVPELGAWNPRFGVRMTWMGGGNWEAVVSLNNRIGNREAQYKYVVVQPGNPDKWEGGGNRTIRLGASGATTDYDDRWQV